MHANSLYLFLSFFHPSAAVSQKSNHAEVHNANHVFNAIHSSMRQWGSSLNHNGMSFFTATVPAGTQLYHGTSKPEFIQGMQWLAFEPEHAFLFARPNRGPPPDDRPNPPGGPPGGEFTEDPYRPPHGTKESHAARPDHHGFQQGKRFGRPHMRDNQRPFAQDSPDQYQKTGYLHTYVPIHDLQLLYIDGLSAGKTPNGTLDTQDKLLLNLTSSGPGDVMRNEFARAAGMCNLTATLWEGKIDGIIRMEGGFEIILCDFEEHLQRVDVISITEEEKHDNPKRGGFMGGWPYISAVVSRYNGIGSGRVRLDYENFVSVFAYHGIEGLFSNDVQSDYSMPRLQNVADADIGRVRNDVTEMILSKDLNEERYSRDWQAVADTVVSRYSVPLHYLHTDKTIRSDSEALEEYLRNLVLPFIEFSNRNKTTEARRCVSQLIPPLPTPPSIPASLAHKTVHAITNHICDVLLTSLSTLSEPQTQTSAIHQATDLIDALVSYLQWTTWKACSGCADDQICFIPIWPLGSHEDHARPKCLDAEDISRRSGYWGSAGKRPGGPPPPPPPKHEKGRKDHDDVVKML